MLPEEVRVIAENLIYDMKFAIKPESDACAMRWLLLARCKYPELAKRLRRLEDTCASHKYPRKLIARAV